MTAETTVVRWRCRECGRYVRTDTVHNAHLAEGPAAVLMVGIGACDCADPYPVTVVEADRKAVA